MEAHVGFDRSLVNGILALPNLIQKVPVTDAVRSARP